MLPLTVSVIIPCHSLERLESTRQAIASVIGQTRAPDELIVAIDHNRALLDELQTTAPSMVTFVLNEGLRGASPTRNAGIRRATGDIVVNLDDDAIATPGWLERLIARFSDPRVVGASGCSTPDWRSASPPAWFPEEFQFMIGCTGHYQFIRKANGEVRNVTGTNMAFRRSVLETVGLWREDFGRGHTKTGGEEAELCLRIRNRLPGSMIIYEDRAEVRHKVPDERARLSYIFMYAYQEGKVRAQLRRLTISMSKNPLSEEYRFFIILLTQSIPSRFIRLWRREAREQLAVIVCIIALVVTGYIVERLRNG